MELDFLGLEKQPASDRRRSFRGIQNAISKMNPEVIKSVIASASNSSLAVSGAHCVSPPLSFYTAPTAGAIGTERSEEAAPMTIFYNGMVSVFDVPKDQAESILKMAMAETSNNVEAAGKLGASSHQDLAEEGLPVARRKSLERFFEKRKERLMSVSPYVTPKAHDHQTAAAKWAL